MDVGVGSSWSVALMSMWAGTYFSDGLMFESIPEGGPRVAASYVACYLMCGAMCHLAGPTYKEAWDPSYRFYKSYKTIAVLGMIWSLSLVFREYDKMLAFTVIPLYTVCWFSCHFAILLQEGRLNQAKERRLAQAAAQKKTDSEVSPMATKSPRKKKL